MIQLVLQAFYREFLSELPIRSVLHPEIVLTMKASISFHTYLTIKVMNIV